MKTFTQYKHLWLATLVLFLLNLGLMGWIWQSPAGPTGRGRGETPGLFLEQQLELTPSQKEQYKLLREDHHHQTKMLRDSIRQMKEEYFRYIGQAEVGDSVIVQKSNAIAKSMAKIDKITFQHFSDVRKLCTPQQQKKFDEVIDEMLRRLAANGERPAGPPPHDGAMPPPPPPR